MFDIHDVDYVAYMLNINFDKFTKEDFLVGMNIEREHGCINPLTNVTNNDPIKTAKIAYAHLLEYPNYYNSEYGLPVFEKFLKERL